MWRPEEYKNPHKKSTSEDFGLGEQAVYGWEYNVFEAGADAMLEGFKREGWKLTGEDVIPARGGYPEIHLPNTGMMGYLVFIPEEK